MGWLEGIFLALLVAAALHVAVGLWHGYRCPYCRAARAALREWQPSWRVWTDRLSHRATEADRVVVAVFYREPRVITLPPPYRLLAVSRERMEVSELPDAHDSPYTILGRK